jgi:hypothetical protein
MADPLIHRYVQLHDKLIKSQPEAAKEALVRFSDLHRKSERWFSTLFLASVIFALLALAQMLGFSPTAELYGQKISEIPERTFFAVAMSGFLYVIAMIYGLNGLTYDSIIRWTARETYGSEYDLIYRSFLSVQIFSEIGSIINLVKVERSEWPAVLGIRLCTSIFALVALGLVVFPLGVMFYFCSLISQADTSLAAFEWWFTGSFLMVGVAHFIIRIISLIAIGGDD